MKPVQLGATSLVAFGFVFHTYVYAVEAEWFAVEFWVWSLTPTSRRQASKLIVANVTIVSLET
jgi:hypothetical protein